MVILQCLEDYEEYYAELERCVVAKKGNTYLCVETKNTLQFESEPTPNGDTMQVVILKKKLPVGKFAIMSTS